MKRLLTIMIVCLISMATIFANGGAETNTSATKPIEFKVSYGLPETHYEGEALKLFEEYVEKETNGGIDVVLFANNLLAADKEAMEMIQQNVIQMCPCGIAVLASFEKSFNILTSPYLFKDTAQLTEVLNGDVGKAFLDTMENSGFKGLGYGSLGFTNITNNNKPITSADDLKGMKLRVMQNAILLDFFKAVGANPVAMALSEVFSALQQGVIDGQSNPLGIILSNNYQEVQKYISLTGDTAGLVVFAMNNDYFNNLSPEYQRIIQEGVDIASKYMMENSDRDEAEAYDKLIATGKCEINDVSDDVKKELFNRGYSVIEKYGNEANPELFAMIKKELEL